MRGLFGFLLLALLFLAPVQEAKANCTAPCTKTQVTTDINTNWPDNTTGLITPALLRSTVLDLVNSYLDVNGASTFTCTTHQFLVSIVTLSSYACAQPAFSDLTGIASLAQGGLGASQAGATINQIPVYPGGSGAAVPTLVATAANNSCTTTPAQCAILFGYANPVWWGADPTGVADSTSAINSAVAALTSGGVVYFPPGQFKTTSQISVAGQGIRFWGAGRYATIIKPNFGNNNVFNLTGQNGIEFHDLGIQGPAAVATSGTALNFNGVQGCHVENVWISELFDGISLNNSTNCMVTRVKMYDMYGLYGVASSNGGGNVITANQLDPLFWSTTQYSMTSGFAAWTTSHAYTAGQVVSNASSWFVVQTAGTSSGVAGGPQPTTFGTLINDGTVQWYFLGAQNASGVKIFSTANSNFVTNNDISGPWSQGIQINGSDNNIIIGNTIGQTIGIGIQLQTNATNSYIAENYFNIMGIFGIAVGDNNGSANGTHVVNNRINGTGWDCIQIQGAVDWVVTDNQITGCGGITGAQGVDIAAATLTGNISSNIFIPSAGMASAIKVAAGSTDFFTISNNNVQTSSISYAGTGTHNIIRDNIGYNPVGLTAGTSTGTSASTITAGPSPETHYITQPATFNAAVKLGATTICTVATATVPCVIELGPNESYSVTWVTTQPTYSKFVH